MPILIGSLAFAQEAPEDLEEIVVTGSRIRQRLEDAPVSVVVLNRDDIDRASEDAIGKVVQQLPANTGSPVNTNVNNGGDGATRVDLRGLGASRTLVMVNGRRFVYGGVGGDTSADLNMIPTSMVERVEVMGVGSSTIYGSDAIGGVVNFITREDYNGAELDLSYTWAEEGDGAIKSARFFAGQSSERGYVTFGGELVDQDAVFQDARKYSKDTEYLRSDGSVGTTGSPSTPQGLFVVPDGNALGLEPGWYTRVTGSGEPTTAEDFRPFIDPDDNFNYAPDNYLQTPSQRQYFWLVGGFNFSPSLSLFVEGLLHHRESEQRLAASSFRTNGGYILPNGRPGIPANNFYNPFGVDILRGTRRIEEQGGRYFSQDVDTQRYVAGLRGPLGGSWNWELSATYGRNDTIAVTEGDFRVDNMRLAVGPSGLDASGRVVCGDPDPATGIVADANMVPGCVPINLFGGMGPDGRGTITPEMLDFVTDPLTDKGYNEQQIYELLFRGDFGAIQGRPIRWAAGASYRVESAGNALDPGKVSGVTGGGLVTSLGEGGQFTATEAYAETVLPLLADLPGADALNLTAGMRLSEFSTFGFVSTFQGGLMYRPVRQLTLRTGYGQVFRAPPVANVYESTLDDFTNAADPCGNDPTPEQQANCAANGVPGGSYVQPEFDPYPFTFGGNQDLQPEEGDSISAGMTFTPSFLDGFSLSVDYWRTTIDDVITLYPDAGQILQVCADDGAADACDRITRYPDGTIELIDATHVNAASLTSEGWDFDVAYTMPVGPGSLGLRLMATYLSSYDITPYKGADTVGAAGTRYQYYSFPRWRGLGYVEYSAGPWFGSWQTQYVGSMAECLVDEFLPEDAFQGCRTIDDGWYQDLQFGFRMESGPSLTLTVSNLTGEDPPRVNFYPNANTDPATYPLLGRTYFVSLSYRIE